MQACANAHVSDSPSGSPTAHNAGTQALTYWTQWQELSERLAALLLTPHACEAFVESIKACASLLMQLTREEPDAAIFHMVHPAPDKLLRYSVLHAMHTAMLLTLIGERKNWGEQLTGTAVKAGLTMNLSITNLQIELAQHVGPLNSRQQQAIDAHPLASWRMLRELGVSDEEWLIAVAQHHEQPDGKGYPQRLTSTIHPLADAIRTCDVFGAKISPRISRCGMPTPRAAAEIFRQRSAGYFGATIIRELGLYPPGCLVELASGQRAVVVQRTQDPNAPHVVLIGDAQGQVVSAFTRIDSKAENGRAILAASADQRWAERVSPEAILGAR